MPEDTVNTAPESTPTNETAPSAPVESSPSVDQSSQQQSSEQSHDAALDRAAQAAIDGKGAEGARQAFEGEKQEEETETPVQESEESAQVEQPTANLDERTKNLLGRFQLDQQDLPADAARREKFLNNLQQRAADQDRLGRELAEMRNRLNRGNTADPNAQQQQAQQQGQQGQQAAQASFEEQLKPLVEYFGPEVAKPFADAVNATVQQQIAPLVQANQVYWQNLAEQHKSQGLAEARKSLPDSVKLEGETLKQLEGEAWKLIYAKAQAVAQQEGRNLMPWEYNLSHAISDAAKLLFQQDIQKAERMKLANSQRRALRGSAERGTQTPTGRAALTDEEKQDIAARAALAGKGVKGIMAELQAAGA